MRKKTFLKYRKKTKKARITDEELDELLDLMESGKIDESLAIIERYQRRKHLVLDDRLYSEMLKIYLSRVRGILRGDLLTKITAIYEQREKLETLRGKIGLESVYWLNYQRIKTLDDNQVASIYQLFDELEKNRTILSPIFIDHITILLKAVLGLILFKKGNPDKALEIYLEASSINMKNGWILLQSSIVNNIGTVYGRRNEIDLSIEKYNEAKNLAQEIGYERAFYTAIVNIIFMLYDKGDFQEVLKMSKEFYKTAKENDNHDFIGIALYTLVGSSIEFKLTSQIQLYLDELEELSRKYSKRRMITYHFKYAKALTLRNSKKLADLVEAQALFADINDNPPPNLIAFKPAFLLFELIFKELEMTGNEELLAILEEKVQTMKEKAKQYDSTFILAETYLLESKLALLRNDMTKAQELLDSALKLAREKGLGETILKISKAYDKFLDEKQKWEELFSKQTPLKERLNIAQLDKLIDEAVHRRLDNIKAVPEEPIYLFILEYSGITLYSCNFQKDKTVDEQLVGGFLAAINTFCQEMFTEKGYLERVKYKDYNIILKPLAESFICSYVIRGESHLASTKLEKFVERVEKSPIIEELNVSKITGLVHSGYEKIGTMVEEIFS